MIINCRIKNRHFNTTNNELFYGRYELNIVIEFKNLVLEEHDIFVSQQNSIVLALIIDFNNITF